MCWNKVCRHYYLLQKQSFKCVLENHYSKNIKNNFKKKSKNYNLAKYVFCIVVRLLLLNVCSEDLLITLNKCLWKSSLLVKLCVWNHWMHCTLGSLINVSPFIFFQTIFQLPPRLLGPPPFLLPLSILIKFSTLWE